MKTPRLRRPVAILSPCLLALASPIALAQRGVQINLDPASGLDIVGDAANEPTLAVSPLDPLVMVVGWRQFPTVNSDSRFAGVGYTIDGGETWINSGQLAAPPDQPFNAEQTDPVLTVDATGTFYYWSEVFRPNPPTTHYVYRSFDNGMTWDQPDPVESPATPGDKEWLVCDRSGGIGDGHLYGGWNNFNLGGQCYVESTDGGDSWTDPVRIADAGGTQWMMQFAVGPDGELYAAWRNYASNAIFVTKSLNARDDQVQTTFDAFGGGGQNGLDLRVDASNDPGFLNISPSGFHQVYIDVDRSGGPFHGDVYILWSDDRNDRCDIIFARSRDGGVTWQSGIRVNDDSTSNNACQWMPSMSVAPNGRIDVVWYDTRDDLVALPESRLYYAYSEDGGDTWSPNKLLSESFATTIGYPSQSKIGDYIQSKSDEEHAHVVYSATFNGGQDLYYLRTTRLLLDVDRLFAGQQGQFRITNGRPNAQSAILFSTNGLGSVFVPQIDATVSLAAPQLAGNPQLTDAAGSAVWNLPIPGNAAGTDVWFQAVQFESTSNVVMTTVLP